MREVKKLSPTSLHLFESNQEEFYLKYMSDAKPEWQLQSNAMSIGSGFDAFVKCNLYQHLFGHNGDGVYDLKRLFNEQVQNEELRVWCWDASKYAFDCYRTWGNYDELLDELEQSEEAPRFEFTLMSEIGGVPLVGKPDLWYKRNVDVVYDWKVMGFCSRHPQSPKKLHKSCRDCWGIDRWKPTRGGGEPKPHKLYKEIEHCGHKIGEHYLEEVDKKWADQIAIYAWMLGVPVGSEDMVVGIDQLACKPSPDPEKDRNPLIRVAQHRCRVSKDWQEKLLERLQVCWTATQTGHIFTDLSKEDNDARCEILDMQQTETEDDDFWDSLKDRTYRG